MLRRSHLLLLIVAVPILIVVADHFFGQRGLPSVQQRVQEYLGADYLASADNQLVWNAARPFVIKTQYEHQLSINTAHRGDALNIYVLREDPKNYFDTSCNCTYLGQDNTIVCDERVLDVLRQTIRLHPEHLSQYDWMTDEEKDDVVRMVNAQFRLFVTKWIIGHEVGHFVLGHAQSSSSAEVREREDQADRFVIERLTSDDLSAPAWFWFLISNLITATYSTYADVPAEGTPFPTLVLADDPNQHPPLLVRMLDMSLLLLKVYPSVNDASDYFASIKQSISQEPNGLASQLCSRETNDSFIGDGPTDIVFLPAGAGDPKPETYLTLGAQLRRLMEYDAAIKTLTDGIDLMVESRESDPQLALDLLLRTYLERGFAYYQLGDYENASADWTAAAELQPNNPIALNNLGFALYALGASDAAIAKWQRAIDLDPSLADSWAGLGIALYGNGQSENAVSAFREALARNPSYASLEWLSYEAAWPEDALQAADAILSLIESA